MSIRAKTIAAISFVLVFLLAFTYLILSFFWFKGYLDIENDNNRVSIQRVNDILQNESSQLAVSLADWSNWDDTYKYIQDKNKQYEDSNLVVQTYSDLKINAIVFVDLKGNVIYAKSYDYLNNKPISVDPLISYLAINDNVLFSSVSKNLAQAKTGIIQLPYGPFLFVTRPILTTEGKGPVMGTMLFGEYLNRDKLSKIEKLTQLDISLFPAYDTNSPPDVLSARINLIQNGNYFYTKALSEKITAGYILIKDPGANPVYVLRIERPRTIYNQGKQTLFYFMELEFVVFVIFALLIILLVERVVVLRIMLLYSELSKIIKENILPSQVTVKGNDEIGKLAKSINSLLSRLTNSSNK